MSVTPSSSTAPVPAPQRASSGMRSVAFSAFASIGGLGFALISAPLQARGLGPTGRGEVADVIAQLSLISTLAGIGAGAYATKELARTGKAGQTVWTGAVIVAVPTVVLLVLSGPLSHALGVGDEHRTHLLHAGLIFTALGLLPTTVLLALAVGTHRWGLIAANQLGAAGAFALALLALTAFGAMSVSGVVWSFLGANLAALAFLLPCARRLERPRGAALRLLPPALAFGLTTHVAISAAIFNGYLDQAVLGHLGEIRGLGYYAIAVTIAGLPAALTRGMSQFFFVRSAETGAKEVAASVRLVLLLVTFLAVGLAVAVWPLVTLLFGSAYQPAVPLVWILLVEVVLVTATTSVAATMMGLGKASIPALSEVICVGLTVPLLLVLIPPLGAYGAALASSLAGAVRFGLVIAFASRLTGEPAREFVRIRSRDVAVLRLRAIEQAARLQHRVARRRR